MSLGWLRLAALFLAALAMALIAGFFYAYACSVMVGLAQLDAAGFVRAMQAINATVRNGAFAFSFFGAFLFTAIAALLYLPCRRERAARLVLAALALYTLGAFVVTFAFNVPLNEALAQAPDLRRGAAGLRGAVDALEPGADAGLHRRLSDALRRHLLRGAGRARAAGLAPARQAAGVRRRAGQLPGPPGGDSALARAQPPASCAAAATNGSAHSRKVSRGSQWGVWPGRWQYSQMMSRSRSM